MDNYYGERVVLNIGDTHTITCEDVTTIVMGLESGEVSYRFKDMAADATSNWRLTENLRTDNVFVANNDQDIIVTAISASVFQYRRE